MSKVPRWDKISSTLQDEILSYADNEFSALDFIERAWVGEGGDFDDVIGAIKAEVEAFAKQKLDAYFAPLELGMRVAQRAEKSAAEIIYFDTESVKADDQSKKFLEFVKVSGLHSMWIQNPFGDYYFPTTVKLNGGKKWSDDK